MTKVGTTRRLQPKKPTQVHVPIKRRSPKTAPTNG